MVKGLNENVFKEICKQLQKENPKGRIEHRTLHSNLVSSGKYDNRPAIKAIHDHIKPGYLGEVEYGAYRIKEEFED
jgi:hypothetical protein